MTEFITKLYENEYFMPGLVGVLLVLIALFFIVLFSGKKKPAKKEEFVSESKTTEPVSENIDFDHGEYVKETTAEFELTPVADIKPTPENFEVDVETEESPTHEIEEKSVDEIPLGDFNFDELSKSISQELDNLKEEDKYASTAQIPVVTEAPTVAPVMDVKPDVTPAPVSEPDAEFITDAFKEESNVTPVEVTPVSDINANSEPVIKEDATPLFARFSPETYDINNKD